jgi:hypothetical protein
MQDDDAEDDIFLAHGFILYYKVRQLKSGKV